MWIVQIALRRPYTFIVLAVVIAMSGSLAALRAPIDIFPSINIPVVSVVWSYNGMLPKDMSDRVIYYYERQLTSQVSNIEHIESESLNGYGTVKIYFQKGVDIGSALAQVSSARFSHSLDPNRTSRDPRLHGPRNSASSGGR
jgi:multidrug efflux pump subunit AcrB